MAEQRPRWDATRIFILVIVVIFLISSLALSGMVIWEQFFKKDPATSAADTQNTSQAAADNCTMTQTDAEAIPVPEVYKPDGAVTELQTTDLKEGTGDAVKAGDCLVTKYYGTLASDGKVFDENFTQDSALQFTVGQGQVIQGWDEGLIGMKAGGTRRIVIPANLAYGEAGSGTIPANSDLVFVVQLVAIKKD